MMATIYELIGRLVVRFVRIRYRRQIRIALRLGIAGDGGRRLPGVPRASPRRASTAASAVVPGVQDALAGALTHSLAS